MSVSLAQIAYEAYCTEVDWKSQRSGEELPLWEGLPLSTQKGWDASVRKILETLDRLRRGEL